MSMFSRWDATGDSGGSDGRQDNELTDSLLTACDNAPLEALEIGSQARDPGDVYDVFPLLAMPLRLLGSGRNSMPISWRIVTIAADDELVTSGQLKHSMRDLLDRVREWAKKSESFGEIVGPGRSPNLCFGAFPSPSPAEAENREAGESQSGLQDFKSNERGAWGGGSGGVGGSLRRISRIKGRYSKVEHEKRGVDEAEEEEWGKTAREADEKEQVEKAARQAWEAEETETAAEQREQAREAVQAVLYAHSTWLILCPTLRRPALRRLENRHCGSSHLPEKGHGSSHLPEKHHDGSHLPGKQQQQQEEEEERQDRLFRSPVISRHMSSALPVPSWSFSSSPSSPSSSPSHSASYKAASLPSKAARSRRAAYQTRQSRSDTDISATGVWRLISPPESYGLPGLVSAAHSSLLSPSHSLSGLTLKLHLPPRSPPLTPSSRSPLLTPSSRSPPLTPSSRSPPLTPSSRSPHLTFSTQSPPFTPSQSPPLPPSSQSPPLPPSSQSPPLPPSSQSPPLPPSSQSPPLPPSSQSPPLPPSSQSPPLPPSSQSPPLPPSSQSPLTPLPLSPPLTPLSQSPPLTLSHSSTAPPSPPARRYSVQSVCQHHGSISRARQAGVVEP
ncbi:unnamed protein product [Closterium sp. Naga37s-1]|nr:unnamed protein product [Closterium sp. Naga37s-1]